MDITNNIGYYLRPNPTDTAEKAPYLPKLVPNGVANLNDIAAKVAESLPVSEERAKLLIRENFTESLKMALAGYTVDMGALRMKARIPGSMPCEDTPFDPEANACVIDLYADDELSGAFDALKPVKLTAAQLANAIKVSNVMDVETEHFGEIHGTNEFMILGNGVTLDAEGESAKLVDRKTGAELATAEVVTVSKGQRATCKFNPVEGGIAKGSYGLVVTTFGLIGESTPRVFRKPVTLVEPIPEPDPLAVSEDGDVKVMTLGTLSNKTPCTMTGTNVGYDDAAENGIYEVRAAIEGSEYVWKSSKGGGFDASEVTLTFELQPGQEAPAPGSYDGIVAFERNGGSEGSEEIQSTRPVKVVIE